MHINTHTHTHTKRVPHRHADWGFLFSHLVRVHWEPRHWYTVYFSTPPTALVRKANALVQACSSPCPYLHVAATFCFLQCPRLWQSSVSDDHLYFQFTPWLFSVCQNPNVKTSKPTWQESVLLEALHFMSFRSVLLLGSLWTSATKTRLRLTNEIGWPTFFAFV